ncbi:hypothetical protein F0562_025946 [Nyssa sinensis]|uniref:Uncharacterized protein n=1 Tax=Nyssa sinensis TaxID=561372 RepID=A0A5J5B9E7_9ASTE|nr:hypothetical protein F0562_025946 [Nyssa sinensis]
MDMMVHTLNIGPMVINVEHDHVNVANIVDHSSSGLSVINDEGDDVFFFFVQTDNENVNVNIGYGGINDVSAAEDGSRPQDLVLSKPSQEPEADDTNLQRLKSSLADGNQLESSEEATGCRSQDAMMSDAEISSKIEPIKQLFVERTEDYGIPQLEKLYTLVVKGVFEIKDTGDVEDLKSSVLSFLLKGVDYRLVLVVLY